MAVCIRSGIISAASAPAMGIGEQTVMLWLGHRDSRMVRHYFHLHDQDAQTQMNKLITVGKPGAA